ncbi:IclR family transcriptional regulator [Georgenia daeguensis]|uniref:IclR family transcriptional regulator n=1 Tax=Georgenia daeguensis TaxID=908355 RepID=A0ABP8EY11_9MICO
MSGGEMAANGGEDGQRQGIQSVEVGMRVLTALERGGQPMSLSQIALGSGMQPSKAHRYLVSLCRTGLTYQLPSGLYDLGPTMRRLGAEALRRTNEVAVTSDYASILRDTTGHSVNVAVWGDDGPIVVRWAHGSHPLAVTVRVGATLPLLASSIGLVFASFLPQPMVGSAITAAQKRAGSTWTDERVRTETAKVREAGYAVTSGGVIPGISSVAAPVYTATDPLPLAMSVVLPDDQGTPAELERVGRALLDMTLTISRELGVAR